MTSGFSFVIIFHGFRDHRNLHSFPTRRSSDLSRLLLHALCKLDGGKVEQRSGRTDVPQFQLDGLGDGGVGERSEEHTSELQSRQYLVCRLLLEKKKERNMRN